jgi:hypothetical protein
MYVYQDAEEDRHRFGLPGLAFDLTNTMAPLQHLGSNAEGTHARSTFDVFRSESLLRARIRLTRSWTRRLTDGISGRVTL